MDIGDLSMSILRGEVVVIEIWRYELKGEF